MTAPPPKEDAEREANVRADKAGRDLASGTVFLVQSGILDGWVCAPKSMDIEAVQAAADRDIFPAGTTRGWRVEAISDGEIEARNSPGLCAEDETRQHWHVTC